MLIDIDQNESIIPEEDMSELNFMKTNIWIMIIVNGWAILKWTNKVICNLIVKMKCNFGEPVLQFFFRGSGGISVECILQTLYTNRYTYKLHLLLIVGVNTLSSLELT